MSAPAAAPPCVRSDLAPGLSVLHSVFGLPGFRGEQDAIIRHVTNGGNCLVLMPTGGGKSLCYQLPSLLRQGCGIVVSPLIALMRDQVAGLLEAGVKAAVLNSTLSFDEASDVEARLIAGDLDLLYVAPERLLTPRCLALLAVRRSRCLRSTRRIACRNGAMTFGRNMSACRSSPSVFRTCRASR